MFRPGVLMGMKVFDGSRWIYANLDPKGPLRWAGWLGWLGWLGLTLLIFIYIFKDISFRISVRI